MVRGNRKNSGDNPKLKEKKEAILKNARNKMGISEEKRADFQNRMKEKRERQAKKKEQPSNSRVKEVAGAQNITPDAARETIIARRKARATQASEVRTGLVNKRMEERKNQIMSKRGITAEEASNIMSGRVAQRAGQIASNRGITVEQATQRAQNQMYGQRGLEGAINRARMANRRQVATEQIATAQGLTPGAAAEQIAAQVAKRAENISNRRGIGIGEAQKQAQAKFFGSSNQRGRLRQR